MAYIIANLVLQKFDPPWFWISLIVGCMAFLALTYRDIFRLSGKKLAWALLTVRTLGVLVLLVALIKPAWQHVIEQTERPQLAVIVDNSQSMSLSQRTRSGEWVNRYQLLRDWIQESPAAKEMRERFDVRLFDIFGKELDSEKLPDEPSIEQTDLIRAMRSVGGRLRGQHVAGVALISDGRDTTGRESYLVLREYPLPIYTLGFASLPGGDGRGVDLAVVSVDCPARTLVHNAVPIKVLIRKDGGSDMDVPLRIERAGTLLAIKHIRLGKGSVEKIINLNYTPAEPGDFVLTARLPSQPNERTTVNNASMFKLRVEAEPIRVLYIEGVLRAEYKFLRERLGQDPDVDLISFVRAASPQQISITGVLAGSELLSPERLEKIDVVLLGDFDARMIDERSYTALHDWIEAGGGLMILGGYQNLSEQGLSRTALADVLPVEMMGGGLQQIDQPFRFELTYEGRRHPSLNITEDMTRDAQLWKSLPELKGIVAVKQAKPGATVLARHPQLNPHASSREGYIVLATQSFGKGVAAVFTADTTWRWSRLLRLSGRSDALYVRFWSQMVRWLAHRDAATEQTALQISTDAALYKRGNRVSVTVNRNPAVMLPSEEGESNSLELTVITPDERTIPLTPIGDITNVNHWTATYFPDRGGRFKVSARLLSTDVDLANQQTEFLVEGSKIELEDPTPNTAVMQQIARFTGGIYAEINDDQAVTELIHSLPTDPRITNKAHTSQVWNSPALFMVFLVLVSTEWIVRRKKQLV